ncbi:MAG: hypothetical protein ACT4QD_27185 [Acidobacteriota bacterium]
MYCPKCGRQLFANETVCNACGIPVAGAAAAAAAAPAGPRVLQRPLLVTVLAVLQFLGATTWLIAALVVMGSGLDPDLPQATGAALAVLFGVFAAAQILCGMGLLRLQPYGRSLQLVFAWIGLLGIPVGTVISILILIYLYKPGIKALFSGKQASELSTEEWTEVSRVSASSTVVVLLIVAAVVVVVIAVGGILAAIAIPGLLRSRMAANEASAIGHLRAVNAAQAAYAAVCSGGGFAVALEDLARPEAGAGTSFLEPDMLARGEAAGYRIRLERNASTDVVTVGSAAKTCNGSANDPASSYFVTAEPVSPGSSGERYFAADSTGVIVSSAQPIDNPIVLSATVMPIQ